MSPDPDPDPDPDRAWSRELEFRRQRNELRDPRDPAREGYDAEELCTECWEPVSGCLCGGAS